MGTFTFRSPQVPVPLNSPQLDRQAYDVDSQAEEEKEEEE